jgi:hypothetical protein
MVNAIPDFGDVICSRKGSCIYTNVPRRITRHSPDGFAWGYGGSAPADFALNILSVFIGQRLAENLYMDFKFEIVASIPKEGGTIPRQMIMSWIDAQVKKRNEVKI